MAQFHKSKKKGLDPMEKPFDRSNTELKRILEESTSNIEKKRRPSSRTALEHEPTYSRLPDRPTNSGGHDYESPPSTVNSPKTDETARTGHDSSAKQGSPERDKNTGEDLPRTTPPKSKPQEQHGASAPADSHRYLEFKDGDVVHLIRSQEEPLTSGTLTPSRVCSECREAYFGPDHHSLKTPMEKTEGPEAAPPQKKPRDKPMKKDPPCAIPESPMGIMAQPTKEPMSGSPPGPIKDVPDASKEGQTKHQPDKTEPDDAMVAVKAPRMEEQPKKQKPPTSQLEPSTNERSSFPEPTSSGKSAPSNTARTVIKGLTLRPEILLEVLEKPEQKTKTPTNKEEELPRTDYLKAQPKAGVEQKPQSEQMKSSTAPRSESPLGQKEGRSEREPPASKLEPLAKDKSSYPETMSPGKATREQAPKPIPPCTVIKGLTLRPEILLEVLEKPEPKAKSPKASPRMDDLKAQAEDGVEPKPQSEENMDEQIKSSPAPRDKSPLGPKARHLVREPPDSDLEPSTKKKSSSPETMSPGKATQEPSRKPIPPCTVIRGLTLRPEILLEVIEKPEKVPTVEEKPPVIITEPAVSEMQRLGHQESRLEPTVMVAEQSKKDEKKPPESDQKPSEEKKPPELKPSEEKKPPEPKPSEEKKPSELKPSEEMKPPELKPPEEKKPSELKPPEEKKASDLKPAEEQKPFTESEQKPSEEKKPLVDDSQKRKHKKSAPKADPEDSLSDTSCEFDPSDEETPEKSKMPTKRSSFNRMNKPKVHFGGEKT